MSIYEALTDFLSPEAKQRRSQAYYGLLENIGNELSQFLSPRGRQTASNIGQIVDTVNPVSDIGRLGQEFNQGNYLDTAIGVGSYVLPAGIIRKYGRKTAEEAAQLIAETLALYGGSMADVTEQAYEAVIQRLNQPGPMPEVVGALAGGLAGRSRPTTKNITMPDGTKIPRPKTMEDVPSLRGLSLDDALFLARQEPHIIDGGKGTEGAYIGGPRNIQNRRQLNKQRDFMDAEIDSGAEGGDWYDRYRNAVETVTNDLNDATWMSNLEGMYSAGVDPSSELGFALKDTNTAIAYNLPVKPARPAQQEASIRAIEANDPSLFQLGEKTGEYARKINPKSAGKVEATGVNDFRHLRTLGFTEADGSAQRNTVGKSGHKYSDYETALAVDRANQRQAAGRSDWTGEQTQAAPWVKQKADDLYERSEKRYLRIAEQQLEREGSNFPPGAIEERAYTLAFKEANKQIGDFFDKHTAFGTYEAQPFVDSGQLPGLATASQEERGILASMPESTWANTGGRDDIYANTRLANTGYAMRVQPTTKMQGVYTPPSGVTEYNPGEVARPLVSFDIGDDKIKRLTPADRALMDAGEAVRAYVDVQGAGAWHKPFIHRPGQGKVSDHNSIFGELPEKRPLSQDELGILQTIGEKYELGDVIDTGQGATFTNFEKDFDDKLNLSTQEAKGIIGELNDLNIFSEVNRARVESGYLGFEDAWKAGEGSGEVTQSLIEILSNVPEGVYTAFNNNSKIGENALRRIARDKKLSKKFGATRKDIENARSIIGKGAGWIDRLKNALEKGVILPGLAAFVLDRSMSEENLDDES